MSLPPFQSSVVDPNRCDELALSLRSQGESEYGRRQQSMLTTRPRHRSIRFDRSDRCEETRGHRKGTSRPSLRLRNHSDTRPTRGNQPATYLYGGGPVRYWPSRDPIGERGGINLYGMVGNDPVGRLDRLGLVALHRELLESITTNKNGWIVSSSQSADASTTREFSYDNLIYGEGSASIFFGVSVSCDQDTGEPIQQGMPNLPKPQAEGAITSADSDARQWEIAVQGPHDGRPLYKKELVLAYSMSASVDNTGTLAPTTGFLGGVAPAFVPGGAWAAPFGAAAGSELGRYLEQAGGGSAGVLGQIEFSCSCNRDWKGSGIPKWTINVRWASSQKADNMTINGQGFAGMVPNPQYAAMMRSIEVDPQNEQAYRDWFGQRGGSSPRMWKHEPGMDFIEFR